MEAGAPTLFQGVDKSSAAFRLMQQMGWEEGSGLGKNLQGMKEHIRVKKKQDSAGIGVDEKMKARANWALNTMTYDNILKNLKVVGAQAPKDDTEEEDSDDEVEAKREEEEELKVLKVTRPQGRYKKREQGKLVSDYSKTDLAAILGAVGGKTVIKATTQEYQSNKILSLSNLDVAKCKAPPEASTEAGPESVGDISAPAPGKAKRKHKSEVKVIDETSEDPVFDTPLPDLPSDWWGIKYGFVRAGGLGANSEAKKTERSAFCEQDQENLYKLVQDKATTGKQGLGIGDRKPRKVGGADWKGQKKVLDTGSDEEEELDEGTDKNDSKSAPNNFECENTKVRKRKSRSGSIEETDRESTGKNIEKTRTKRVCHEDGSNVSVAATVVNDSRIVACEGNLESLHWKTVCKQLLAEAPSQTLSFKKLQKRAIAAGVFAHEVQLDRMVASLKQKLEKSSRFVVDGKKVSLSVKVGA